MARRREAKRESRFGETRAGESGDLPAKPPYPTSITGPDVVLVLDVLNDLANRLARRIANEKHTAACTNCMADKELVVTARQLRGRLRRAG